MGRASMEQMMAVDLVGVVRRASSRTLGGNCAYADDDVMVLEHLARRAIEAGLTDRLKPDVQRHCKEAMARGWKDRDDPDQSVAGSPPHSTAEAQT